MKVRWFGDLLSMQIAEIIEIIETTNLNPYFFLFPM